ncbi:uncharacterized protein G2W53_035373 [Senna tora]|uniref:Uncharacterized protein n=1 Tax=Senna tora TaxID=362788 RepID=A0A834SQA1_9FABA|nr:uncharacterized protein G2W53_035373 [Senna tora]
MMRFEHFAFNQKPNNLGAQGPVIWASTQKADSERGRFGFWDPKESL